MRCTKRALVALACLGLASIFVHAQTYNAKIPFEFAAGKQQHPAGTYTFSHDKANPKVLLLRPQSGPAIGIPILTRLAPREIQDQQAQLVFDEVDGKYTLAELYLPATDGFYLGSVLVEHKHVTIKTAK